MNMQDMEACFPLWEDAAASHLPGGLHPRLGDGKLRFYPKPSAQLTAYLTVVRDALAEMTSRDSTRSWPRATTALCATGWRTARTSSPTRRPTGPRRPEAAKLFEMEFGPKSPPSTRCGSSASSTRATARYG
jgi:hypothetical protein